MTGGGPWVGARSGQGSGRFAPAALPQSTLRAPPGGHDRPPLESGESAQFSIDKNAQFSIVIDRVRACASFSNSSRRYQYGSRRLALAVSIRLYRIALASAPCGLPENSQFFVPPRTAGSPVRRRCCPASAAGGPDNGSASALLSGTMSRYFSLRKVGFGGRLQRTGSSPRIHFRRRPPTTRVPTSVPRTQYRLRRDYRQRPATTSEPHI